MKGKRLIDYSDYESKITILTDRIEIQDPDPLTKSSQKIQRILLIVFGSIFFIAITGMLTGLFVTKKDLDSIVTVGICMVFLPFWILSILLVYGGIIEKKKEVLFWDKIIFDTDSIKLSIPDNPKFVPLRFEEIEYIAYDHYKRDIANIPFRDVWGFVIYMEVSYYNQKHNDLFRIYKNLNKENVLQVYDQIHTFNVNNYPISLTKPPRSRLLTFFLYVSLCGSPIVGIFLLLLSAI